MIESYKNHNPEIEDNVYIHENSSIIGRVKISRKVSIWPGVVIRGDVNRIEIKEMSNIQDNTVVHVAGKHPTIIGKYVTIGHLAVIHACKIGNNTLIGMGATILDGAKIGDNCIIGANSLVTKNKKIPDNSLVMGAPAKVVRKLNQNEINGLADHAEHYWELANDYLNKGGKNE
ncbi:MAG: gamma carbonic anhydrase family protein [Candidatus Mcinerneyibacterium aminivorans]|uniref:Gamma carbonic anhydrase family protein n=1 Tax=Candidatus Mcinerneyibacterium aminivorans TaxID=2703815 RepID=A0A5D0MGZ5_9BACT|nr:MAG: gamma carbonic anhydrase family protein [Candidatus Mcinerneyibacterium aminivorans]